MGNPYCEYPLIWKGFGRYEWSALDAQVCELLTASPDARFLCMINLNTPYWATHSLYYLNERNPAERAFGESVRNALARTGAPYDACSFGDLAALDLSRYRLILLNSTLLITPERERLLKERVLKDGRTVLWTYAPGLVDGKTLDAARVARFAGVHDLCQSRHPPIRT